MSRPIEGLFRDKPQEVVYEMSQTDRKKLKQSHYEVVDKVPDDPKNGTYFDMSELDGLAYGEFKKKFLKMCAEMPQNQVKIIYIPMELWTDKYGQKAYLTPNNPIYNITQLIKKDHQVMQKELRNYIFIFYRSSGWFAFNVNQYNPNEFMVYVSNVETLSYDDSHSAALSGNKSNAKATITTKDVDEVKDAAVAKKKDELVELIADKAATSSDEEDFMASVDADDAKIIELLDDIADDSYGKPKMSKARATRMTKVDDDFKSARTNSGKTLKEIIDNPEGAKELPIEPIKVASINSEEWEHMQFTEFNKTYDIDEDIRLILESFADKEYPIVTRDIQVEDISTSEDYLVTYTVAMEDMSGRQFTIKFDIPKFVNNRFMRLRGNDKYISGQLFNLPCTKTDDDTVQVVSNYRKIMISRYGSMGKSMPASDRLIKALAKYKGKKIKITAGDCHRTCSKYELPVDYIDLTYNYYSIKTPSYTFYFDQDYFYKNYQIDATKGLPIAINNDNSTIWYVSPESMSYPGEPVSNYIAEMLCYEDDEFKEIYQTQKPATKHVYSRASIMAAQIPMVVVICNSIPFTEMLQRAKIEYEFSEKRVRYDPNTQGCIPFSDGYLIYKLTYPSSLMMNGLMDCDTENYRFADMNKKSTWLDFLDNFGGRIKADGLDNFKEVFMDPITQEVCRDCGVPDDYIDILIYANGLLGDNKYIKHTDMASNRYRTNEIVAGHLYQVLAGEYIKYRAQAKRGNKKANFSIKRSAVIDEILSNPVASDLSSMSPLLEQEAANSATFKGLSGLNADRAYSLDKRTYDDSMTGVLALSTGFASNVGINRQTAIDMNIAGKRGYIKSTQNDNRSVTKRFSMTEAVTPFGSTREAI